MKYPQACQGCGAPNNPEFGGFVPPNSNRRQILEPGTGDWAVDILIFGLCPGEREEEEGEPFVGPSGNYLNRAFSANQLGHLKIRKGNILNCRPIEKGKTKIVNRVQQYIKVSEIQDCVARWLIPELDACPPNVYILTLGDLAFETVFNGHPTRYSARKPGSTGTFSLSRGHRIRRERNPRDLAYQLRQWCGLDPVLFDFELPDGRGEE